MRRPAVRSQWVELRLFRLLCLPVQLFAGYLQPAMEREEDVVRSSQFDENAVILAVSFRSDHCRFDLYLKNSCLSRVCIGLF